MDDEVQWKSTTKFLYDALDFDYNYNISPSKKNSKHSKTRKKSSNSSPRLPSSRSPNSGIFDFEEDPTHSRPSPKGLGEDGSSILPFEKPFKVKSRRGLREVRLRSKLSIDDLLLIIPDWAICSVCSEVFKQPTVTPECGHTFCYQCLELVMQSKNKECPLCRKEFGVDLDLKELSPNHQLIQVIDSLKVRCRWGIKLVDGGEWKHDSEGCPEIVEWQNLCIHDEKCQYIPVPCSSKGCTTIVQRRSLEEHLTNCQFRNIICELCYSSYPFKDKEEHRKTCPHYKSICPKGCGQMVANQEKKLHIQKHCPEVEAPCIYSEIGCTYSGKKQNLEEHIPTCIFHMLKPFIVKTQETIANLVMIQQEQQQKIKQQQLEMGQLKQIVVLQEEQIFQLQSTNRKLQLSSGNSQALEILKSPSSAPIPITTDTGRASLAGGLLSRLYRIIDPTDSTKQEERGSIHSL